MPNNAAALQLVIDNICRVLVMVDVVIASPTQATIDATVAAAEGLLPLTLRPNYSAGGVNFSWESYRKSLIEAITTTTQAITVVSGPYEIRSRTRT